MTRKEQMKQMEGILAQYKAMIEEREKELSALKAELVGYERAYNDALGRPSAIAKSMVPPLRPPRTNVKQTVLDLLHQQGSAGLNAATAVEMAAKRNEIIHQQTVSSLLSRFKSDGVAVYDGTVYRLRQFAQESAEAKPMH